MIYSMSQSIRSMKGVNKIINRPAWAVGESASLIGRNPNSYGHIQRETHSINRNVVFCINQLGGVGRNKSQFHTPADGVNCKDEDYTLLYISQIQNFFRNTINKKLRDNKIDFDPLNNNYELCFVGEEEKFWKDIEYCQEIRGRTCNLSRELKSNTNSIPSFDSGKIFTHLDGRAQVEIYLRTDTADAQGGKVIINIPTYILEKINYVNSKIPNWVNELYPILGKHTLAILNNSYYFEVSDDNNNKSSAAPAKLLAEDGYGVPLFGLLAYSSSNSCCCTVATNLEITRHLRFVSNALPAKSCFENKGNWCWGNNGTPKGCNKICGYWNNIN
jgi:hypothetical protein